MREKIIKPGFATVSGMTFKGSVRRGESAFSECLLVKPITAGPSNLEIGRLISWQIPKSFLTAVRQQGLRLDWGRASRQRVGESEARKMRLM
jgi:hypothetical protein